MGFPAFKIFGRHKQAIKSKVCKPVAAKSLPSKNSKSSTPSTSNDKHEIAQYLGKIQTLLKNPSNAKKAAQIVEDMLKSKK